MKKQNILFTLLALSLILSLTACSGNKEAGENKVENDSSSQQESTMTESKAEEMKTIKVGATPLPHAEILEFIKPALEEQNYKLEIVEFTDYVTPNLALEDGSIDANFFQHQPYMESFAKDHNLKLSNVGAIHLEPMGVYSKKITAIDQLQKGDTVAIPNDATNGGRALLLLQANQLIKLADNVGLEATELDITENPYELKFTAVDAAQLPRTLDDVTISVINSNYALEAGFNPVADSLIIEGTDSPYANIITVLTGNEDKPEIKALVDSLQSDAVKEFIKTQYKDAIIPSF